MTSTNCRSEAGRAVAYGSLPGVVLDAGALAQTSLALHDAGKSAGVPLIEFHVSSVHAREEFRHRSWLSPSARSALVGPGARGYPLAIGALVLDTEKER